MIIGMILMFTSEIVALVYGFYKGDGFWSILGWVIVAELVLRTVGFVSTMISCALGAGEN
jgi:hypothetical protein